MLRHFRIACALIALTASVARADEVLFNNGDKLTGEILSADGGKLKIKTAVAGEVTVDLKDVATFKTDKPLQVRLQDKTIVRGVVASATTQPATGTVIADGKSIPLTDIKRIGSGGKWTGAIIANGNLQRGNTHSMSLGVAIDVSLRRDDEFNDDRFTLGGAYNFGKQTTGGVESTDTDNWFGLGKYDKFLSEKLYVYGLLRVDHDRIAALNYRIAPGVGLGYQWVETSDFNLSTEAGVSFVHEDYIPDGTDDRIALRLAYHVDKKLNDKVSVFHNLEWLPAFEDPGDYNLNADAGIRAKMTNNMFSELKFQYQRDSTPAPGALKNDTRFILGVGWTF